MDDDDGEGLAEELPLEVDDPESLLDSELVVDVVELEVDLTI